MKLSNFNRIGFVVVSFLIIALLTHLESFASANTNSVLPRDKHGSLLPLDLVGELPLTSENNYRPTLSRDGYQIKTNGEKNNFGILKMSEVGKPIRQYGNGSFHIQLNNNKNTILSWVPEWDKMVGVLHYFIYEHDGLNKTIIAKLRRTSGRGFIMYDFQSKTWRELPVVLGEPDIRVSNHNNPSYLRGNVITSECGGALVPRYDRKYRTTDGKHRTSRHDLIVRYERRGGSYRDEKVAIDDYTKLEINDYLADREQIDERILLVVSLHVAVKRNQGMAP